MDLFLAGSLFILVVFVFVFSIILVSLLTKIHFNGAYFAETSDERLKAIIKLADFKKNDRVLDLGSGDGRIVLAVAKLDIKATGIEVNPLLVAISKLKLSLADPIAKKNARFIQGNLWEFNTTPYNVVIVYGIPSMMSELKKKLIRELQPGAKVITVLFAFSTRKPTKSIHQVHLYKKQDLVV